MLSITCTSIGKKYYKEVLFKDFDYEFTASEKYVITGSNSSGKSTLLKIIGGVLTPTNGSIKYSLSTDKYNIFSFCSPELHLLDDFTVIELFNFHFKFKSPKIPISVQISQSDLSPFLHKKYGELSSGLKNKIKLTLALFTDSPALLLDEPCTNFDDTNINWYQQMIDKYCQNQLIIVASNQVSEYTFCSKKITLHSYKPTP
jgi:ABC-type multidrug transport system ATPase subunit